MKDVSDLKEVPNEGDILVWVHWWCPFDDEEILKSASSGGCFIKNLPVITAGTLESCFLKTCVCFPVGICRLTLGRCQFRHLGESLVCLGDEGVKEHLGWDWAAELIGFCSLRFRGTKTSLPVRDYATSHIFLRFPEKIGEEAGESLGLRAFFSGFRMSCACVSWVVS